ncbi:hypothetical protein [Capnocytophaga stomatis]
MSEATAGSKFGDFVGSRRLTINACAVRTLIPFHLKEKNRERRNSDKI